MPKRIGRAADNNESPAKFAQAVTPSDTVDIPGWTPRALYVGVGGDINILLEGDTAPVVFTAVPVGILPVRAQRVFSTLTDATKIVALA